MLTKPSRYLLLGLGILALVLTGINLISQSADFWAIWPIWAAAMPVAGIIGAFELRRHRLLGIWLGAGGMLILGLFAIDIWEGGAWWFFWPAAVWLVISLALVGLTVDVLSYVPTSRPATDDDLPKAP